MTKETRLLQDVTPSTHSPGTFSWSWDTAETHSLMTVMGVRVIEEKTNEDESLEPAVPQKRPRKCRGKENQPHTFLMPKRFRRSAGSLLAVSCSWERMPDELLLVIFHFLSLPHLLKASRVSKHWHRLAFDKSLWYSVDLSKSSLPLGTVSQVLEAGVVVLRCPHSFLGEPMFKDGSQLSVQYLDLSHCVISTSTIFRILHRSHRILSLSLEGLSLSDNVIRAIGQNENLLRLNLSTCSQFGPNSLSQMLSNCSRLDELNLSWCQFNSEHIRTMVSHIPASVTQLNISGYRNILHNSDVKTICRRCPQISNLDLSDSTMITPDCFPALHSLSHLQHLGLSRCHEIPTPSLVNLGEIATLKTLNIYGLVRDSSINVKELIAQIKINTFPLTTIGRPTDSTAKLRSIWGIDCRLSLHSQ